MIIDTFCTPVVNFMSLTAWISDEPHFLVGTDWGFELMTLLW